MIRASELYGRVLVDLDTAEKIGSIDEIIVDPYAPCVAGYVVATGRGLFGSGPRTLVATESVHAIGPDALTIRRTANVGDVGSHLDTLPRLSELTGRKMVSYGGRLLGTIEDALIDERDGRIIGYPLDANGLTSGLDRFFTLGLSSSQLEYVRADADLRVGAKLVVVPDEAVVTVDEERLPALPDGSIQASEAPAAPAEAKRRQSSSRRAAAAVRSAPSVELLSADEASATPPSDDLAPHEDLADTTPIAVPTGRRRQASSVG
jgi:uncharacterized protein YrrD